MALEIGPIIITAGREQTFSSDGFGGCYGPSPTPSWQQSVYGELVRVFEKKLVDRRKAAQKNYDTRLANMPALYTSLLTQIAADAEKKGDTPVEKLSIESNALKELIAKNSD